MKMHPIRGEIWLDDPTLARVEDALRSWLGLD